MMQGQAMNNRAESYVQSALTNAVETVANAPLGQRNDTLFKQAAAVAQLLHHGVIGEEVWWDALRAAGERAGLDTFEIHDTLKNALKEGTGTPRDLPGNMVNGQTSG